MMSESEENSGLPELLQREHDVIVVGSGAAGLAVAVTCRLHGLSTLVLESSDKIGGTTALSGGVVWIPLNPFRVSTPTPDQLQDAVDYIASEAGANFDKAAATSYVAGAGEAITFLVEHGGLKFTGPSFWPDYHQAQPGAREGGRSMRVEDFDGRLLGENFKRLRPPLKSMTLFGGMMVSGNDLYHLLRAKHSPRSLWYVTKILIRHALDRMRYSRGTRLTNGSALSARLLHRYLLLGGDLLTSASLKHLTQHEARVVGCKVEVEGHLRELKAAKAVVLATGGLGHNHEMRRTLHTTGQMSVRDSVSLVPKTVKGEGIMAALEVGAHLNTKQHDIAAWVPVSRVPGSDLTKLYFPHFFDRSKPGFLMVNAAGIRFVNEAKSYHDIGREMKARGFNEAFIICDHLALTRYGVGVVPPLSPLTKRWIRSGYLVRSADFSGLAKSSGIEPEGLLRTISAYNEYASEGKDPLFDKGNTAYETFIGDSEAKKNPCVAPLSSPPFYAIRVVLGDIGTFCGVSTDRSGRVRDFSGGSITGLYAVGNDRASIFGGTYPAAGITLGPALVHAVQAGRHIGSTELSND